MTTILDSVKPEKESSDEIEVYKKNILASSSPTGLDLIKNVYTNAIEYRGIGHGNRGLGTLLGLLFLCIVVTLSTLFIMTELGHRKFSSVRLVVTVLFVCIGNPLAVYFLLRCVRFEFFRPLDEPIIFDREHRKVYRIHRDVKPGWKGLFAKWPIRTAIYDWNLIQAERHALVDRNMTITGRTHWLVFEVRKACKDPRIVDTFTLGSGIRDGKATVSAVFEQIRRFMEARGPHLPPGESLVRVEPPATLLQCLARTGPYGATLRRWWQHSRLSTIAGFLIFPLALPFVTLLGVLSWLTYVTAPQFDWSNEVVAAVGEPLADNGPV